MAIKRCHRFAKISVTYDWRNIYRVIKVAATMKHQIRSLSLIKIATILTTMVSLASGHGRLRDPPSRSSAWRDGFKVPPDYNDTEGFCGGYERQWLVNKGRCGICGDPFDEIIKPHEAPGGVFATGTITRTYTEGQVIPVKIDITALHKGYYEFRLCPNNNVRQDPSQECFNRNVLSFVNGPPFTKFDVSGLKSGIDFNARLQLPPGITCSQCILQWTYTTGNRWGTCANGTGALGCGPQEMFRACADISIVPRGGSGLTPSADVTATAGTLTPITPQPTTTTTTPMTSLSPTTTRHTTMPGARVPIRMTRPPLTSLSFPFDTPPTTTLPTPTMLAPTTALPLPALQPPTMTLSPTSSPTTGSIRCISYAPVPSQRILGGMAEWCNTNCRLGYCPPSYCICVR